ncbi:retron system putative HNH endonuclease [Desulfovibrio inopinatus]|uniref:retron system putative HNH endonuclease n=1 Tax=Desulfovibrio inopinatus TaxID=102109 RepID=UPI0003FC6852|nr:retron system putative HNH endonuclease [Desulfovibrio inopinatus]
MKYIRKFSSPESFEDWKRRHPGADWHEFSLPHNAPVKDDLADSLRREQGRICCYCEKRLSRRRSHIEHIKPRSVFPDSTLKYSNLAASCNGGPTRQNACCGHKKGAWYSPRFVSPYDRSCEHRFLVTAAGEIAPRNPKDISAAETIRRLGLNTPDLCAMRRTVYDVLIELKSTLPPERFQEHIEQSLLPDGNGLFEPFWSTIEYVGTMLTLDGLEIPDELPAPRKTKKRKRRW